MEELVEKRVWQRVRGDGDPADRLRGLLADQGRVWGAYRAMSRRGGAWRRLLEQKEEQIACLRGLLRAMTGQGTARPSSGGGPVDLMQCLEAERRILGELSELSREGEWSPVLEILRDRQKGQCRILLELLGSM